MRSADRRAISKLGVPQAILMENAGRSVAEGAADVLGGVRGKLIAIVCGKGNNGGDGFVAARHLLAAGATVRVIMLARQSDLGGETRRQFAILRRLEKGRGGLVILPAASSKRFTGAGRPAAVIDAILGTGFRGKLRGPVKRAVEWINAAGCPVISVDIPSGLNSDDGTVTDLSVRADLCVTMGTLKTGMLLGSGPEMCGRIIVANLGVGMEELAPSGERIYRLLDKDIRGILPSRPRTSHKHSVGKILVLTGSVGLTGAAALAAAAAMRSGAGAVILGVPRSIYPVLAKKLTEVMVKPLPESPGGTLCAASLGAVEKELDWADVILTGPGLGMGDDTHDFMENLLKSRNKRFLIDADGLNHIAEDKKLLRHLKRNTCILTPHAGEFGRLTGFSAPEIEKGRIILTREYARRCGVTLVLKGSPTVIADPAGNVYINSTGNPGMATAGMGDVLAGIISALWAESDQPAGSACGGVFVHGRAGDLSRKSLGMRSLVARDVLNRLPEVIMSYESI